KGHSALPQSSERVRPGCSRDELGRRPSTGEVVSHQGGAVRHPTTTRLGDIGVVSLWAVGVDPKDEWRRLQGKPSSDRLQRPRLDFAPASAWGSVKGAYN